MSGNRSFSKNSSQRGRMAATSLAASGVHPGTGGVDSLLVHVSTAFERTAIWYTTRVVTGSTGYKWRPISDLPKDLGSFRDRELEALFQTWAEQRKILSQDQALAQFNVELKREWAIETGIIEGIYTLDRGVTQTLVERGIEASYIPHDATNRDPELVARTIQAHADVLDGLFAFIKGERLLTTSYIKELHAALLRHQDTVTVFDQSGRSFDTELLKGDYKILPNNPSREDGSVHEYCPPEHVAAEMDCLIAIHSGHSVRDFRPEIQSAWLHHAFTQIHPFQDGNGRVARAIASLVFLKAGYFPLVVTREDRAQYIDSLESADSGDLEALIRFFSVAQKRPLTKAIGLAIDARPATNIVQAVEATRDLLSGLGQIVPRDWLVAKAMAGTLVSSTAKKLNFTAGLLTEQIGSADQDFTFVVSGLDDPPAKAYEVVSRKLRYDPDFNAYHHSYALTLGAPSGRSTIIVSLHGVGPAFRGLLAASAFFQVDETDPVPLSDDIFRISYKEALVAISARFGPWLESCLVKGIELWRRTLL